MCYFNDNITVELNNTHGWVGMTMWQGAFITFKNLPSGMLIFYKKKITKVGIKHLNKGNVQPHIQSLNPLWCLMVTKILHYNFLKNNYVYILLHVIVHYQFSKMFGVMSMWGGPIKGLLDTTGESSYRWHGYKNYEQICEPWTLDVLLA